MEDCVADVTDATEWTEQNVSEWLEKNHFSEDIIFLFEQHKINGPVLLSLTETDLRELPLRIKLLGDIKNLMIRLSILKSNTHLVRGGRVNAANSRANSGHTCALSNEQRILRRKSRLSSEDSTDGRYAERTDGQFQPEYLKTLISFLYVFFVCLVTAFVMTIVHDQVPDRDHYPPLPDLVLDNIPLMPWAFTAAELCATAMLLIWMVILVFHKHRFILMRRMFSLGGSIFLLRCCTMLITSLSVPGVHLECDPETFNTLQLKLRRTWQIVAGLGMSMRGVRSCGDYMFSGHTCVLTMLNFFITEYSPRRMTSLHTATWVMNLFGIFFILAAHEHYSIDVFIAFYISSRMFLNYHALANNVTLTMPDRRRTRVWFPLFSYFESGCLGIVPNAYESPIGLRDIWSKCMFFSTKSS